MRISKSAQQMKLSDIMATMKKEQQGAPEAAVATADVAAVLEMPTISQ